MALDQDQSRLLAEMAEGFCKLPSETVRKICNEIVFFGTALSRAEAEQRIRALVESSGASEDDAGAALLWISAIVQSVDVTSVGRSVTDLHELALSLEDYPALPDLVRTIGNAASKSALEIVRRVARRSAVVGLLPYFDDVQTTIDLRLIGSGGDVGSESDALEKAGLVDLEPIATVQITTDGGDSGGITFQAGIEELSYLAERIGAVLEKMKHVRQGLGRDN